MEDRKVDELLLKMDAFIENIKKSKESSKQFLQDAGIVDKEGDLEDRYKDICIPQELV
ncbi:MULTISPECIES: hypothetical protein [unclassified Arcicella]|uniref:hypothetical protein n=1 Tax=unclassified Arcicella TaxID=2644986 RepID=UPI002862731B|nr:MULTISPECIES: hypothetical protein [unclassified Arcicella]MDR6564408.1 hypothetical protein [Arcicella sp. BE51]MDR6814157.1 hypothetical protein [Arcicella sp. BE140]MDR6825469.1 hypothetical protein [Arcicella sp. BE139]